jgi:hypothetical protein
VGVFYLINEKGEPLHAFALVLGLMGGVFLLSFWASTFFAATIRAALATVLGVGVLGAAGAFAAWCGGQFDGLQKPLVKALIVQFQFPPDFFSKNSLPFMIAGGALLVGGLALLQSLRRYRNSSDLGSLIKNAAALLLLLIGLVFIGADFQLSADRRPAQVLEADLNSLLAGIVNRDPELLKTGASLHNSDLEATGALDDELKRWLRNATIKLTSTPPPMELLEAKPEKYNREFAERYGLRLFGNSLVQFEVSFPNGRSFNSSLSF